MGIEGIQGGELRAFISSPRARTPDSEGPLDRSQEVRPQQALGSSGPGKEEAKSRVAPRPVEATNSGRDGTKLFKDAATDRIVTQIISRDMEVLKQIPPEDYLKVVTKVRELNGLLFDTKA